MLRTQFLSFTRPLGASICCKDIKMKTEMPKLCMRTINKDHSQSSASSFTVGLESPPGGGQMAPPVDDIEYKNAKSFDSIPKDWSCAPIIGTAYTVFENLMMRRDTIGSIMKKNHKYGPVLRRKVGSMEYLTVSDVDAVEKIHRFEGKYPKRLVMEPWSAWREEQGLSKGIIVEDGNAHWRQMRSVLDKQMMRPRQVASYTNDIYTVATDMVERLRQLRETPSGVISKLEKEMFYWSLESIGTILYERRLGALQDSRDKELETFVSEVRKMFQSTFAAIALPREFAKKYFPYGVRKHDNAWSTIFALAEKVITAKINQIKSGNIDEKEGAGFLSTLLTSGSLTIDEIYANVSELMLAATDTTSLTTLWVLYEVSMRPDLQKALREEIVREIPKDQCIPSYDQIQRLRLMKACIKEILRLYPLTVVVTRITNEDLVLGGYQIPAGTSVLPNLVSLGRDKDIFSEPEEFKPERWLRGDGEKINPFAWLSFGYGQRGCIGRRVAELEIKCLMTEVLRKFEISRTTTEPVLGSSSGLLAPSKPLNICFREINN